MKGLLAALAIATLTAGVAEAETLQYAIPFNEADGFTKAGAAWAKAVEEATKGEITIKLAPNSALVPLPETLDAVADGVVPIGMGVASFTSGTIPALGLIEMVGGLPLDKPPTGEALAAIWKDVDALYQEHHAKALWGAPAFSTGLICRSGFVKSASDWAGKKIRTAGRWQSKQIEAMGAVPVPLPPSELYVALQNGVVDCALMVPTIVTSARLYEVAPYYTDFDLPSNVTITIIGTDVWDGLTKAQQAAIQKVSDEATQAAAKSIRQLATDNLDELRKKGKVYTLSEAERAAFLAASKPVFESVIAAAGKGPGKAMADTLSGYR